MAWHSDRTIFLQSLLQLICILSMIGALITIVSYALWLDIRTKSRKLLLHLAAADLLSAGSLLYGLTEFFQKNSINCKVQSFLTTTANIAQLTIYIMISVYVFTAVCSREKHNELIRKYAAYICWIVSIVVVSIGAVRDALGYDGTLIKFGWCWISEESTYANVWRIITSTGLECFSYIFVPLFYFLAYWKLDESLKDLTRLSIHDYNSLHQLCKSQKKLMFVPVAFFLVRICSTIKCLLYILRIEASRNWFLSYFQTFGICSQGFVNFILYCICTPRVRKRLGQLKNWKKRDVRGGHIDYNVNERTRLLRRH